MPKPNLVELSKLTRLLVLSSTTAAGSGHPTSALSATDLMVNLLFGGLFRADVKRPQYAGNDRLIFSKGHASPLLYTLYAVAGGIRIGELTRLRQFGSRLEGHPMPTFPWTEAPTGSLGQGLSIGLGEALYAERWKLPYRTFVLLGDSELAEGSVWEAMMLAGFRKTKNLIGMVDVNALGQSGPTMLRHNLATYERRITSFGWKVLKVDGHDHVALSRSYARAMQLAKPGPVIILAKTQKGHGVPSIAGKQGWHGKALSMKELHRAEAALGPVNHRLRGQVAKPARVTAPRFTTRAAGLAIPRRPVSPREAIGEALMQLGTKNPHLVVLDGEVKNSTFTEAFGKKFPKQFVQAYIAEQNMVGMAVGLAARGGLPVTATFAAFLTRAADQLRMAAYAGTHQIYVGTHAGVAIGQDGASQMGLEDIALFRTLQNSTVLYPSDDVAATRLLQLAAGGKGIVYLRATRGTLTRVYNAKTKFSVGGSHTLRHSRHDKATIVAAGVTLHEALAAATQLAKQGVRVRVIDLYSIKPIDTTTLVKAAQETKRLIVVEDHVGPGGMAEAVRTALGKLAGRVESLHVHKIPKSGQPQELLAHQNIDRTAIVRAILDH